MKKWGIVFAVVLMVLVAHVVPAHAAFGAHPYNYKSTADFNIPVYDAAIENQITYIGPNEAVYVGSMKSNGYWEVKVYTRANGWVLGYISDQNYQDYLWKFNNSGLDFAVWNDPCNKSKAVDVRVMYFEKTFNISNDIGGWVATIPAHSLVGIATGNDWFGYGNNLHMDYMGSSSRIYVRLSDNSVFVPNGCEAGTYYIDVLGSGDPASYRATNLNSLDD